MKMSSILITLLLTWQGAQVITPTVELTKNAIVPHVVQVDSRNASTEPQTTQPSQMIKGSREFNRDVPYGEFFDAEESEPPFYLKPEFGGLDGSDHRREIRPNAAGQRLDMDQYNRQVRPPVGP